MTDIYDGRVCKNGKRLKHVAWIREATELLAEFTGSVAFALFGGMATDAALGNGLALAALVYCTAPMSGGKLNPAVSAAAVWAAPVYAFRYLNIVKMFCEWVAQVLGAMLGAYIATKLSHGVTGVGCFIPPDGTPPAVVWGAEAAGTALLTYTVLVTAIEDTGSTRFGALAPLAIGLSLYVGANAMGPWTGAAFNPARYLAPLAVAHCANHHHARWYLAGQASGCAAATFLYWMREEVHTHMACERVNATTESPVKPKVDMPAYSSMRNLNLDARAQDRYVRSQQR